MLIYPATVGLAFVSALLTLGVHALLAVYYVVDQLATSQKGSPS